MTHTLGAKSQRVKMTQLDNTTAHKTLGTMLAPSLQMKTELDTQETKSNNYARKLLTSLLTLFEAYTAHHTTYIPSVTYTFPIAHHKKETLNKLQSHVTTATMLKLKFNRHTSHAVTYGSLHYLGVDLIALHIEQGIAQTMILIQYLRSESDIGNLTLIALHWWHLITGLSQPLLKQTKKEIKYTGETWFYTLRQFLQRIKGKLHIPDTNKMIPPSLCINDEAIMEKITDKNYDNSDIEKLNRVCIWMQVYNISEITSANRTEITQEAWTGTQKRHINTLWPVQKNGTQQLQYMEKNTH